MSYRLVSISKKLLAKNLSQRIDCDPSSNLLEGCLKNSIALLMSWNCNDVYNNCLHFANAGVLFDFVSDWPPHYAEACIGVVGND